jgi:hypothetical protein
MKPERIKRQIPTTLPSHGEDYTVFITYDALLYPAPAQNRSRPDDINVVRYTGLTWEEVLVQNADWSYVDDKVREDFRQFLREQQQQQPHDK